MMRFKCWLGVSSARQKVANLVDAVRTTLLDSAGKMTDDTLAAARDEEAPAMGLPSSGFISV